MRHIIAYAFAGVLVTIAPAQPAPGSYAFTTLAGRAGMTAGNVDAVGSNARFNGPFGVTVDASGNLYVTDWIGHVVRRITPDGTVTTLAGQAGVVGFTNGTGLAAQFGSDTTWSATVPADTSSTGPYGIAVLPSGTTLVADAGYHVIRQMNTAREVSTFAGIARSAGIADGTQFATFAFPVGVAVDATGAVFVADTQNHSIRRISPTGVVSTIAGGSGWGTADGVGAVAHFLFPMGIAVSPAGNVYVVDCANTVRKLTAIPGQTTWQVTTLAGTPLSNGSTDGTGAAARFGGTTTNGIVTVRITVPSGFLFIPVGSAAYNLGDVVGVAVDGSENVYVCDQVNNTIRKISPAGVVTTIGGTIAGGSADGLGTVARFNRPAGIAVDSAGYLYITDSVNRTIRKGGIAVAPTIATQPAGQTVGLGSTLELTVVATGFPTPTVQWLRNGASISGATNSTLTLSNVQSAQAGNYSATLTNVAGSALTAPAVVAVSAAPAITVQPVNQTILGGATVTLRVTASASPAPTYQWTLDGVPVPGATATTLVLTSVQEAQAGAYRVIVTNINGSTTSSVATLTVNSGRLVNLSIRSALTGSNPLIAGFVVSGGTKPLLVRAIGPALRQFGITTAMADPQLSLQVGTTIISTNDNWSTSTTANQVATAASQVGAFPLTANSLDSAVLASVTNNAVTAQTSARNNTGGVVLLELYDTGPVSASRLVNVSTRAQVGVGENALFAGFAVGGNSPRTLLIRAVGPTLAAFGVSGTLVDPLLEVYNAGATTPRVTNDNWGGTAQLAATFVSVGAFALPAGTSRDAALVTTLPPGTYSAKVSGVGNTTGEVLLEVYEVP